MLLSGTSVSEEFLCPILLSGVGIYPFGFCYGKSEISWIF